MIKPKRIFRTKKETEKAMKRGDPIPILRAPEERCPEGYYLVLDYFRNFPDRISFDMSAPGEGVYVVEHCARIPGTRRREMGP